MKRKALVGLIIAILVIAGAIFVSAQFGEEAPVVKDTTAISKASQKTCGQPAPTCGPNTCGNRCGGTCGIPSCGCR